MPGLLQELQGLGRDCGDDLRTGAAKGETPESGSGPWGSLPLPYDPSHWEKSGRSTRRAHKL